MCVCLCACVFVHAHACLYVCAAFATVSRGGGAAPLLPCSEHPLCTVYVVLPGMAIHRVHLTLHTHTRQRGKEWYSMLQIFATVSYINASFPPMSFSHCDSLSVPKPTHTVTLTATAYPQHDVLAGVTLHYPVIALQERAELKQQSGACTVLPLPLSITGGGNTHAQTHGSGRTLWP